MIAVSKSFPFHFALILIACCGWGSSVALSSPPDHLSVAEKAGADVLLISCSPERPVVSSGDSLQVKAWASTPDAKPLPSSTAYIWSVSTGRIKEEVADALWDLEDSKPGNYTATVRVTAPTGETAQCSLEIVVESLKREHSFRTETRGKHETGRSFLLPAQQEEEGYGLYSYLLLGTPPTDSSRERYLKAIEAYLHMLPEISKLEKYFPPMELNITYLPVNAIPPQVTDTKTLAAWALDHYDYARARFLARRLSENNRDGPYIVSAPVPLSEPATPPHYLWQDLSAVPAQFAGSWIKEFMNQAAQERFWETKNLPQFRLKLRSVISVLATAWPDVRNSMDSYIKLGQSIALP